MFSGLKNKEEFAHFVVGVRSILAIFKDSYANRFFLLVRRAHLGSRLSPG